MTETLTEQNVFFVNFSIDSQTCVGATLGVSVESLVQGPLSSLVRIAGHPRHKMRGEK